MLHFTTSDLVSCLILSKVGINNRFSLYCTVIDCAWGSVQSPNNIKVYLPTGAASSLECDKRCITIRIKKKKNCSYVRINAASFSVLKVTISFKFQIQAQVWLASAQECSTSVVTKVLVALSVEHWTWFLLAQVRMSDKIPSLNRLEPWGWIIYILTIVKSHISWPPCFRPSFPRHVLN